MMRSSPRQLRSSGATGLGVGRTQDSKKTGKIVSSPSKTSSQRNARSQDNNNNKAEENQDVPPTPEKYVFDGVVYTTYQEFVQAKRRRNQQLLVDSGLLSTAQSIKKNASENARKKTTAAATGLKKRKMAEGSEATLRRKSNRLAGIQAGDAYVDDERGGKFTIASGSSAVDGNQEAAGSGPATTSKTPSFYGDRINDGSDMSIRQIIETCDPKWVQEESVPSAEKLFSTTLTSLLNYQEEAPKSVEKKGSSTKPTYSPTSVTSMELAGSSVLDKISKLAVDNVEECVAKVVPDRIYGIAAHPSTSKLIVCAGDKKGYVGIWDVDSAVSSGSNQEADVRNQRSNDGVHLFRFHSSSACCLQWTPSGSALMSASYDGTVRWFDVEAQVSREIFAVYDNQEKFRGRLGSGLDEGHHFWTQYACLDHRFDNEQCLFLSTSVGSALHLDLRSPPSGRITFHQELSEKKINTLSLHPNGYSLVSAGLDCMVKLFDTRRFGTMVSSTSRVISKPIASYHCGKSVNSAFFSPSGRFVVATTMANKLEILQDFHLQQDTEKAPKQARSLRHDNQTGRWLSTFMATFHPALDLFCVGSMRQPRCVELFDPEAATAGKEGLVRDISGEALTAVASRCCFHPSVGSLILVGGNSSGRVTVIR